MPTRPTPVSPVPGVEDSQVEVVPGGRGGGADKASMAWRVGAVVSVIVAVVLNVAMASSASIPVLWTDELGYLANAQILAGVGEALNLAGRPYYLGWSVLITPLWWLFHDPEVVYRAAVWLSTAIGLATIGPLARLCRHLGVDRPQAVIIASIVSLAPSRALMSNFALSEHLITLLVVLTALAALRYASRHDVTSAVLLGVSSAALFATHGRTIPVLAATVAWLAVDAFRGRRLAAGVGVLSVAVVAGASFLAYRHVTSLMYSQSQNREASAVERLLNAQPRALVLSALGQAWYQYAVWGGLALVGALAIIAAASREIRRRKPDVAVWAAGALLGAFGVGVFWVSWVIAAGRDRLDIYAYGRYLESYGAVLAAVGLALALRRLPKWLTVSTAVCATVLTAAFLLVSAPRTPVGGANFWGPTSVTGLLHLDWPQVTDANGPPWVAASVLAAGVLVAVVALGRWPALVAGLVGVVFLASSVVAQFKSVEPYFSTFRASFGIREVFDDFPDATLSFDVWHDPAPSIPRDPVSRNAYQYWCIPRAVEVFNSDVSRPTTDLVIARGEWPQGEAWGAERVAVDTGIFDNALWVMPGGMQEDLIGRRSGD